MSKKTREMCSDHCQPSGRNPEGLDLGCDYAEAEIAKMLAQTPEGMKQALSCSLIKDAIRLDRAKSRVRGVPTEIGQR